MDDDEKYKTKVIKNDLNPHWNEGSGIFSDRFCFTFLW